MNKTKFFSSLLVVALFAAATSVFTSCKDYDDDINDLQKQIDNLSSLKADVTALQTTLTTELNTVKSQLTTAQQNLQAAIDKKADQTTVDGLVTKISGYEAKISGLETQLATLEASLDKYATDEDLAALALAYATISGDIEPLKEAIQKANEGLSTEEAERKAAVEAVQKNIDDQKKALEDLQKKLEDEIAAVAAAAGDAEQVQKLLKAIDDLNKKLEGYDALVKSVSDLKTDMQNMSEELNKKISDQANILNVFVNKRLTSLVLMPDFYWEGIEGIEVPMVPFYAFAQTKEEYKFTYTVIDPTLGNQEVKVTVQNPMGFYVYDKDKKFVVYNSETKDIWEPNPERTWHPSSLQYGDFEFVQKNTEDIWIPGMLHPGAVAKYHVNPTTANLEGLNIAFFENDAEVYTRNGSDFIAPTPREATFKKDGLNTYENGILSIPFDVDESNVLAMFLDWAYNNDTSAPVRDADTHYDIYWPYEPDWAVDNTLFGNYYTGGHGSGWNYYTSGMDEENTTFGTTPLPFIAAQLSSGDTVVTSDYAVVTPAIINIEALADNAPEQLINGYPTNFSDIDYCVVRANHLYESVGYDDADDQDSYGAIPMPATHSVAYDGSIDLSEFVETHYDYTTFARYGQTTVCSVMTDEQLEQLGLHYEYTIVNYTTGEETTSQSAHIEQDKTNPAVFYPRSVTEDGKTITGKTATREAVGREPLIRVDLVYGTGNNKVIVRYGYIKLRIVDQKSSDMEVTINLSDIYMNCGDSARVTWSQMENLILAKLGTNGLLKEEFEQRYYLEVRGGYTNMPYINPNTGDPAGDLYAGAAANRWWAARYYINEDGEYALCQDVEDVADQDELPVGDDAYKNWTADNNWFGRIWYTPHDNSTTGHNWDENTNVLVWEFNNNIDGQSNMTQDGYENMIKVVNATYKSKGLNQKELSAIVRFVSKIDGTSIWVKLVLAVGKVHFAYGDINRRVLDHWYDYKQGYRDNTADTIEVYANVPTPAEVAQTPLSFNDFEKDLKEYWLGKKVIPAIYDADHFDKFWSIGADKKLYTADDEYIGDVTFQFRLPKKGENTVDIDADKKGVWKVDGISGNTYELYLKNNNSEIWAKKNKNAGMSADELICTLTADGIIKYNGRIDNATLKSKGIVAPYTDLEDVVDVVNGAASDILNLIGMYDATGKYQKDVYLTGHAKRTFAAYIEIKVANNCYAPLIGKNYFNVRFLRPINVWPAEKKVTDALNKTEFINIWELLYIRDWRTYAVVMDKMTQKFGDKAVSGTGLDGKTYGKKDVVFWDEGNVPYSFYSISNLYVRRNEIRSDAYLEPAKRTTLTNAADIKKLYTIEDIPALTNGTIEYLKIINKADATDAYSVAGTTGKVASTAADDVLAYTNNGGVVKPFHIYVPIAVEYPWGALRIYTQTAWAVITVDPTVGNE